MEGIKRLLRIVGVPLLCLVVGFGAGLLVHRTLAPSGRFIPTGPDNVNALDSKTGQYCSPMPEGDKYGRFPRCIDLYRKY
jgi:hypothetical protein